MRGWRRDPSPLPLTLSLFDPPLHPLHGCKRLCPACDVADDFSQYELITGDRRRETDREPAFELWHQRTFLKRLKIAADLQVCVFQSNVFRGHPFCLAFFFFFFPAVLRTLESQPDFVCPFYVAAGDRKKKKKSPSVEKIILRNCCFRLDFVPVVCGRGGKKRHRCVRLIRAEIE